MNNMNTINTQTEAHLQSLPYKEIGEFPKHLSLGNVLKRFIDGLGYRYYWATDSLTETDLSFKISADVRSTKETLEHILELSGFILRICQRKHSTSIIEKSSLSFNEIRFQTLNELQEASMLLAQINDDEFKTLEILIQQGENTFGLPIWNAINGPMSDALYHIGQVVSYRRASGNPIHSKVDIFTGKNKI